jgi:isopentenyldiphosphate isomerase
MITEKWDILDEYGKKTGKTTLRGKNFLRQGEYHLVVHIWIISDKGDFLIQRRSDSKKLMPGEWAATGGAAVSGENSFAAAKRELFEELGIKTNSDTILKLLRIKRRNSLLDVWVTTFNGDLNTLKLQKSEVAEVKWVKKEELEKMISVGEFHNYGREYFDKVFEKIDEYRGACV